MKDKLLEMNHFVEGAFLSDGTVSGLQKWLFSRFTVPLDAKDLIFSHEIP